MSVSGSIVFATGVYNVILTFQCIYGRNDEGENEDG